MLPPPHAIPDHAPRLADGRYVLLARIGQGGMAGVYAAWDVRSLGWRAVKIMQPHHAQSKALARRFEEEARTMMALSSPHLVKVFDVGQMRALPFMVMELVPCGSLFEWQEQHGLMPARMAVDVIIELCRALEVVHGAGIVHRDVKPRNVLIDTDGTIKLTDFGIARTEAAGHTRTGFAMGTLGFMSPEQVHDAKSVDLRADLYAAGATLWRLITDREARDLFRFAEQPQLLDGVPFALHDLLRTCLAYDREERFGGAQDLRTALETVRPELPRVPPEAPALPLPFDPPEITHHPEVDFEDLLDHPGDTPHFDPPPLAGQTPGSLPPYADRKQPQAGPPLPELITGRATDEPPPDRPERTRDWRALALIPLGAGLLLAVGALVAVLLAGSHIAATGRRIDETSARLADRVQAATPILEELRRLGGDPGGAERALGDLQQTAAAHERTIAALTFIEEVGAVAGEVAQSDRHEARLVRQRLDRLRSARDAFAAAWSECEAVSAGLPGRWALALDVTEPACEPWGRP